MNKASEYKNREIVRIMDLTDKEVSDLQEFGFKVMRIIGNLYEISVTIKAA